MHYRLPLLQLREMPIALGDYPSQQTKIHFKRLVFELNGKVQSIGNNDRFKLRQTEILENLEKTGDLIDEIQNSRDIRVVIDLWRNSNGIVKSFPVNLSVLEKFREVRSQQGQLALYSLAQLFFEKFDECGDLHVLTTFLRKEFYSRPSYFNNNMEMLRKRASKVFALKGPDFIAEFAIKRSLELNDAMKTFGISEGQSGKYTDVCKQRYYIESLNQLAPGGDSNIFDELIKKEVVKRPYKNDRWLGHEVLSIMIQKVIDADQDLPDNWRDIILKIADDPRISDRSRSYREWWSLLPQEYIEVMQGWMAGFELELFLKALKNFANTSQDDSLKRMFPARACFLQGLYANGLIKLSKLFIGRAPGRYINSLYDKEAKPKFSELDDGDLSVIYLKIGHVHMVEGSHSFSLRLYDELPDGSQLLSYSRRFGRRELGLGLAEKYKRTSYRDAFSVTHNPNLTWQHKVIQELEKQGISVNPEWVLTPRDYKEYRQRFPISIYNQPVEQRTSLSSPLDRYEKNKITSPLHAYRYEKVLEALRLRPNQRVKEIARVVQLKKSVVNHVLFFYRGKKFEMDNSKRWSLLE